MKKRIIGFFSLVVFASVVYFTKNLWMGSVMPSEEVFVETGLIQNDIADLLTGSIQEEISEIIYEEAKDLGLYITKDGLPFGPSGDKWRENFSYYCMFPSTDDILPKDRDYFASIEPLLPKEIYGKIECSNGEVLSYSGKITGKAYADLKYKDGLYDIYIQKDGGSLIGPFPNPYNCIVEICPLILYGTGDYIVRLDAGGDSYDSWLSFDYYDLKNGENLLGTISTNEAGLVGSTNYMRIERGKNTMQLSYKTDTRFYSEQRNDYEADCRISTVYGFVIEKNRASIKDFMFNKPLVYSGCTEEPLVGDVPPNMLYTFDIATKSLSISIDSLIASLIIDLTTLTIK